MNTYESMVFKALTPPTACIHVMHACNQPWYTWYTSSESLLTAQHECIMQSYMHASAVSCNHACKPCAIPNVIADNMNACNHAILHAGVCSFTHSCLHLSHTNKLPLLTTMMLVWLLCITTDRRIHVLGSGGCTMHGLRPSDRSSRYGKRIETSLRPAKHVGHHPNMLRHTSVCCARKGPKQSPGQIDADPSIKSVITKMLG
jgi:hypothetical protein